MSPGSREPRVDGSTTATEPSVAVIRRFNLRTGTPAGQLIKTETAAQAGSDGLLITYDGTK